ncbi:helix-turn-helix domain-containing protein [Paenibacillus thalictri]|uniref:helix-turn-helix domain-containing protein n=1 Tax=Paenibacillus thalictri TaxID=2527873 RepID=UPI0013EF1AE0|nr:helix-turn-helix domain-containing protein [Paenibacillus thalictri]
MKYLGIGRLTNPRKYLFKLIWLGCISACIPVILVSLVYYQLSMNRMETYIQNESESSMTIMKDRAERVLQEIEQESLQLAKDPMVQEEFTAMPNENGLLNMEILRKIALVKNSNSFISEIVLYNSVDKQILSNEFGAVSKQDYKYKDNIDQLLGSPHPTQWTQLKGREGYVTFARLLPLIGTGGPEGVLSFEIETSALSKFLETDTAILTDDQELTIVKLNNPFAENSRLDAVHLRKSAELKGLQMIKSSDQTSGRFWAEGIDGKTAQYRYVKNVFGRTYVSVIPEQAMTEQFNWMRKVMVETLLVFIGVGIFLTYATSKKAYNPIEQLLRHSRALRSGGMEHKQDELDFIKDSLNYLSNETDKLGSYIENIEPSLREKFLFQLLSGYYTRNSTLLEDCKTHGIEAGFTHVVLIVEAENIYKEKRFRPEEKGIVAFSLANVMQEMLRNDALQGYAVPYQGRGVAILQYKSDTSHKAMLDQTLAYVSGLSDTFRQYLSFEISVGIGRFYEHVVDVPVSYKEAENALQYRIFRDSEQALFIDEVEHVKKQTLLRFPADAESAVLEALEQDDLPSAVQHFAQFAEVLQRSQSYVLIYQGYHVLLASLIRSLEKQGVNGADLMEHNLFGQLKSKQTSKEIRSWFEETLFPLYSWLTRKDREAASDTAVQQVCQYIRANCGNDLSLVQCAEIAGVSPSYLSRIFKKKTGTNFLEYVVETKMLEAKRLLKETDHGISEIAAAVGYSERNFIRIFQRNAQMTPGTFRTQHR